MCGKNCETIRDAGIGMADGGGGPCGCCPGADGHGHRDEGSGRSLFRRADGGFTTLASVVAMLLVLSLLFSAAQVHWLQTTAPAIQEVADAGALAAMNVVAKYYIVARAADAVVLSLSLPSLTMFGIGAVLCIVPPLIPLGVEVMSLALDVAAVRDRVAASARTALDSLQAALPVACAVNSMTVIAQNPSGYTGIALPLPLTGQGVGFPGSQIVEQSDQSMRHDNDDVALNAGKADEYEQAKNAAKHIAYNADCGNNPGYCLYQRAATLAGLPAAENPYYASEELWGFNVALQRARAYYRARLANEAPDGAGVEAQVRSACRKAYYAYAVQQLAKGYVHEGQGTFEAYFPLLPANTEQMRQTSLYTDSSWPVSADSVIHGTTACPAYASAGAAGLGSLSQLEAGSLKACPTCGFKASSLGKAGAASSTIDNGFEYHYRIIAEQATIYQQQVAASAQAQNQARESAGSTFETLGQSLRKITAAGMRYDPKPPGRNGCLCVVVDLGTRTAEGPVPAALVGTRAQVGPRIAVSAAALARDEPQEGANVISSMMDAIAQNARDNGSGAFVESGIDWLFDVWGGALAFYGKGVEGFAQGIQSFIDAVPLVGSTPLGSWARQAFLDTIDVLGLSPVDLSTPKPVTVNTVHVLTAANQTLGDALALAKALLGAGQAPDSIQIEGPFGTGITIVLPHDPQQIPQVVLQNVMGLSEVLGRVGASR